MSLRLIIFVLLISHLSFGQNDDLEIYDTAKELILASKEYAEFDVKRNDYNVSAEIVSFVAIGKFFDIDRTNSDGTVEEIAKVENSLKRLNEKKCGKIKIYYSEIVGNVFFAEVFKFKKKNIKYSDRPIFGSSYIYMFKVTPNGVLISEVKKMHYN